MSWQSCMQGKIESKYGSDDAACAAAGSKHDLKDIVTCIVDVVNDADPVTVLADLTGWSLECAFEDEESEKAEAG